MKIDTQILSQISHELRSPLTAIRGYASLLNSGAYGKMSDEAKQTIMQLHASTIREIYLVNDFGTFLKLYFDEHLKEKAESINLMEKIQRVADIYGKEEEKAGKAKFQVKGDANLQMEIKPWAFGIALNSLLKHVVRGGKDEAKVEIEVGELDGHPIIMVKDNEKKLAVTEEEAFKPLTLDIESRSGIELFIASQAVELMEGFKIGILPEYKKGNTFYISKHE